MDKQKLTLLGMAGASVTALFTYFTSPNPHEGVVLNPEAAVRIKANATAPSHTVLPVATPAVAVPEATAPASAGQAFTQTASLPSAKIDEAKRFMQNYKMSTTPEQKYHTLISAYRALKGDVNNAHYIGMTAAQFAVNIKMEAGQYARSIAPAVGYKLPDGSYPNTEDFYNQMLQLEKAVHYMDPVENAPQWEDVVTSSGPLSYKKFTDYMAELQITLGREQFNNYRIKLSSGEHFTTEQQLEYLDKVSKYAQQASLDVKGRDVYKEMGTSRKDLDDLIGRLSEQREKEHSPSGP